MDLAWLWLWCRPAAAALIQPLTWQPPYATGAVLKRKRKRKKMSGIPTNVSSSGRMGVLLWGITPLPAAPPRGGVCAKRLAGNFPVFPQGLDELVQLLA